MGRHVVRHLNPIPVTEPFEGGLQVVLADGGAVKILVSNLRTGSAGFAEILLGILTPGTRVHRIQNFLIGQGCAGDIDALEPLPALLIRPLADVDKQLVVEDFILLRLRQVEEILVVDTIATRAILEEGEGALLTVHQFIFSGVGVLHPVHDAQRHGFLNSVHNQIALLVVIHEGPLVVRSDTEVAIHGIAASIFIIVVAGQYVPNFGTKFSLNHLKITLLLGL